MAQLHRKALRLAPILIVWAVLANSWRLPTVAIGQQQRETQIDKSKHFAYVLPTAWEVRDMAGFAHDVLVLPPLDERNRNVVINDQPGSGSLDELKAKYERDLPKSLKNFKLISSEIITLDDDRKAVKLIHTNTNPGVPVRQINYILQLGSHRYFVAYTGMEYDGDRLDNEIHKFVQTLEDNPEKHPEARQDN